MIKDLYIYNYRSLKYLHWTYDPKNHINILLGKNGVGKSSFLSALRFALTGEVSKEDIADGTEWAKVSVSLDDGCSFSRTIFAKDKPTKVEINGKTSSAKVLSEILEDHFGISVNDIKFVSAKEISSVKPADFGKFISKFLPDKIKSTDVLKKISELSNDQKDTLQMFLPPSFLLADLDSVYDTIFDIRRTKKAELNVLKSKSALNVSAPKRTVADIDKDFLDIAKAEAFASEYKKSLAAYESAVRKKKEYDDAVKSLTEQADAIKAKNPSGKIVSAAENERDDIVKQSVALRSSNTTLKNNEKLLEEVLNNLSTSKCPLSNLVVCTTDKTAAKKEIEDSLANIKSTIEDNEKLLSQLDKKLEDCKARISKYKEQETEYQKKKALLIRLSALKTSCPEVPEKPVPVSAVVDINKKRAELNEEKRIITLYNDALKTVPVIEESEKEIKDLTTILKSLSQGGEIRNYVTSYYLNFFIDTINKIAKKINPEYEFEISTDGGFTFFFKTKATARARTYEFLSQGEKVICDFILLLFCSQFGGTGMVFVDNLNDLDETNIKNIMNLITSLSADYSAIFVAAVDTAEIKTAISGISAQYVF